MGVQATIYGQSLSSLHNQRFIPNMLTSPTMKGETPGARERKRPAPATSTDDPNQKSLHFRF
jgi:hypothetical protein